jgi:hypothetical protein
MHTFCPFIVNELQRQPLITMFMPQSITGFIVDMEAKALPEGNPYLEQAKAFFSEKLPISTSQGKEWKKESGHGHSCVHHSSSRKNACRNNRQS